jgi:hypothetical protein
MTPTDSVLSVNGEVGSVVLTTGDIAEDANYRYMTDAQEAILNNQSGVNTGDMSNADVKAAYEANTNTNVFTDSEKTTLSNQSGTNTGDQIISDSTISLSDITTNNVSTTKHGFAPKGDGNASKFLNAQGEYTIPIGSGNVNTSGTPVDNDFAKFVNGTDIEGRSYAEVRADLNVEDGAEANNINDVNATDLTDGGETTLHYHAADRNRNNHTGTQLANTISNFDTEVSNNSNVVANTAKITNATHTGDVTGSTVLTIGNNVVKNSHIDWGTGSSQINAESIPIKDVGTYYANDNIEFALQQLGEHEVNTSNPHSVTKSQVGLSNVPNTDFTAAVNANTAKISYPAEDSTKLAGIAEGAEVNVQSD